MAQMEIVTLVSPTGLAIGGLLTKSGSVCPVFRWYSIIGSDFLFAYRNGSPIDDLATTDCGGYVCVDSEGGQWPMADVTPT